ncbi:MAG: ArsR family transcriptional regulator [Gaiellaceae bacterium]
MIRDRILELLKTEPLRSRELAEKFACDASQVSRALRQLLQDGVVVNVPAPPAIPMRAPAGSASRTPPTVSASARSSLVWRLVKALW